MCLTMEVTGCLKLSKHSSLHIYKQDSVFPQRSVLLSRAVHVCSCWRAEDPVT